MGKISMNLKWVAGALAFLVFIVEVCTLRSTTARVQH